MVSDPAGEDGRWYLRQPRADRRASVEAAAAARLIQDREGDGRNAAITLSTSGRR